MTYNEYWRLLYAGMSVEDMKIFSYDALGFGLLEDGLYVDGRRLADPVFRARLIRFTRASINGWRYAVENTTEAGLIVTRSVPGADLAHQSRMAEEIARLAGDPNDLGLLDLDRLDRTLALLAANSEVDIAATAARAWTHTIYNAASDAPPRVFSLVTKYRLSQVLASQWFYILDLIGTMAFGIAGFLRAKERRYDLWGVFILTALPAVGGGTLRDLLVGGERHPPFIFKDPTYIYIVLAIVLAGWLMVRFIRLPVMFGSQFGRLLFVADAIGMAAFTVIGARVAIVADLTWFWIPICAALTYAGGGVLLDVVTSREPRTFKGEIYEEVAILGGLLLVALLHYADRVYAVEAFIVASVW